jgi:hypothetical protein
VMQFQDLARHCRLERAVVVGKIRQSVNGHS